MPRRALLRPGGNLNSDSNSEPRLGIESPYPARQLGLSALVLFQTGSKWTCPCCILPNKWTLWLLNMPEPSKKSRSELRRCWAPVRTWTQLASGIIWSYPTNRWLHNLWRKPATVKSGRPTARICRERYMKHHGFQITLTNRIIARVAG